MGWSHFYNGGGKDLFFHAFEKPERAQTLNSINSCVTGHVHNEWSLVVTSANKNAQRRTETHKDAQIRTETHADAH